MIFFNLIHVVNIKNFENLIYNGSFLKGSFVTKKKFGDTP